MSLIVTCGLEVGTDGFIRADGIVIGRYIPERRTVQLKDRDKRRSRERGTRFVEVKPSCFSLIGKLLHIDI